MELLKCSDVCKSFGSKKVLKNVNLIIPKGKIIGLLGKNGTGKSTLIKLINDLLTVDSGSILINGENVGIESKKIISYLPERTYLDKSMSVEEVITYFCDFYENFDEKKARKLLKDSDLNFIGNIEGRDVAYGTSDVIVCDGFTGNILLKTYEGVAKAIMSKIKDLFTKSTKNSLYLFKRSTL